MQLFARELLLIVPCSFISVETEKINSNTAKATLTINEVCRNNTPDFEKFDTVYISIQVTDNNQTINTKTATGMFI